MSSSSPALDVRHLSLFYGSQCLLLDLNFRLPEASLTALCGPNGSGKSTLMKSLAGLHPYRGEILFPRPLKIGYLPQQSPQDFQFPLLVGDFVAMGLWRQKVADPDEAVTQALIQMKAEDLSHKSVGELSRGQFQRVALARSLVHVPQFLLLDEPLTGLDESTADFLMNFLFQFQQQGGTALVVLHDETRRQKYGFQKIDLSHYQFKKNIS